MQQEMLKLQFENAQLQSKVDLLGGSLELNQNIHHSIRREESKKKQNKMKRKKKQQHKRQSHACGKKKKTIFIFYIV